MIPSSLRVHLIWLIFLTVIPLAGLTIFNIAFQYQQNREMAEHEARDLAQLVSMQQSQYIESTQQLLLALAELSEVRQQESARCSPLFANLHEQYPIYTGLGAHYPNGESFCLSLPGDPVSFGDREWFQSALETGTFAFGDYDIGPASGKPMLVVSYPMLDTGGDVESVLVAGLSLEWINERLAELETLPGTVLSVVDRNGTILSHHPDPELVGTEMTNTDLLTTILEQQNDVVEITDETGDKHLVTFVPLSSEIEGAYMVISTPTEVVFADINATLTRNLLILVAIVCVVVIIGWWWSTRFIVRPVKILIDTTHRLTQGNLSARTEMHERRGELGALAISIDQMAESLETRIASEQQAQAEAQHMHQLEMENLERLEHAITEYLTFVDQVAQGDLTRRLTVTHNGTDDQEHAQALQRLRVGMNSMVENLHHLTTQVQQASTRISSASSEILAATAQQAAGATEQSSAMSQAATTVDQVKAIAHQTTRQASTMVEESQQALDVARQGTQVVEETIDGMTTIRQHMDSIAQTVLALAEQTQAIGAIITTVREIADQSNMLALNAAIEAARAGEQGKSFAVVAQQVRDLAERSKAATMQVQDILGEIQRCTSTAVMVTEEGNRGVVDGTQRASDAGNVIHRIATEVENGAQANASIALAAQQQTTGVEQLGQAMRSIQQATQQTLASTRQTEQAARDLHSLAHSLQEAIAVYRL